jgi:hypothetical protein
MQRLLPLVGVLIATYFAGNAAVQMSQTAAVITPSGAATCPATCEAADPPSDPADEPRSPKKAGADPRPFVPVHTALIRFLSDMDDLLDTVHDPASFAAARPKLLARARAQADLAEQQPGRGMSRLSKAAGRELQKAIDRHTESLGRAIRAVPAVRPFFEKDMAEIMDGKPT